ncbi:hypothetical protein ACJX0J_020133, partial [Zea mays]
WILFSSKDQVASVSIKTLSDIFKSGCDQVVHDIFANYFALFDHMLLDVQIQTAHIHLTKNNFQGDKLGMKSNVETRKILGVIILV